MMTPRSSVLIAISALLGEKASPVKDVLAQ
jgi:hypothetical protein